MCVVLRVLTRATTIEVYQFSFEKVSERRGSPTPKPSGIRHFVLYAALLIVYLGHGGGSPHKSVFGRVS